MEGINEDVDERTKLCSTQASTSYSSIAGVSGNSKSDLGDLRFGQQAENMPCDGETSEKCAASCKDQMCGPANPLHRYCSEFWTKKNLLSKFPIIQWAPKYRMKHFVGDLVAGLTVGLTVIPQGMAYAQVAELPPQYGLYSAFMGGLIYCIFGTSKDVTMGPTAIMSLLVAEFASERSPVHGDATYAIILTLFCGLIQMLMGLLNLGFVVQFISFPVISGFTSSAACLIAFSQVKKWLGLKNVPRAFIPSVRETFSKIPQTNLWDMTMGLICMVVLIAMKKVKEVVDNKMKTETNTAKKVIYKIIWLLCTARNAVVVILCAGITAGLHQKIQPSDPDNFFTLTGKVKEGIPTPSVPKFYIDHFDSDTNTTITRNAGEILSDIGEGFIVVTLIGLLESIAIAKAFARRNEYQIDPNQELIAIGISNAISSFFHSYPITGSFSRTAINSQSGVRTPAGGIWTAIVILIALAVLTPYFYFIPQAALAAVIICAVLPMVEYEIIPKLFRVKKLDILPLSITFIVCLLVNIEYGIMAGVGFSILMLVYPMSRPDLNIRHEKALDAENGGDNGDDISASAERHCVIIEPNQGLKFPGIEYIKDKVMKHGVYQDPAKAIILNARHFAGADYTTVQGITQVSEYFHKHSLQFIVACPSDEVKTILDNAEIKGLQIAETVDDGLRLAFAGASPFVSNGDMTDESGKINDAYQVEVNEGNKYTSTDIDQKV